MAKAAFKARRVVFDGLSAWAIVWHHWCRLPLCPAGPLRRGIVQRGRHTSVLPALRARQVCPQDDVADDV